MSNRYFRYIIYSIAIIILLATLFVAAQLFTFYFVSVVKTDLPLEYRLLTNTNSRQAAFDLKNKGLSVNPYVFIVMAKLKGQSRHLNAGGYRFYPGTTANQILNDFAYGHVAVESITIIEGWTFKQMLKLIEENKYIDHQLLGKSPAQIATLLKIPYKNPEGWFFPDTYQFIWGVSDIEILQNAHQLMVQNLQKAWEQRSANLPYKNSYQMLIVASMIAKEAQLPSEQAVISGVILNRLRKGMKLQIDPTVIYGMGDKYQGKITLQALRTSTVYNTYTKYGLPPTPISLPGEISLLAAAHPETSNYIYFVAKGDGSHVFSISLKEHDEAIKKYILHLPNKISVQTHQNSIR